jgi:hypothetical protein
MSNGNSNDFSLSVAVQNIVCTQFAVVRWDWIL